MLLLRADPVPIREEADGSLRVGDSRVLLELVLEAFDDGATPDMIVRRYSTLKLPDVYAVIAYYLNHRSEWTAYLRDRERKGADVFDKVTSGQRDLREIRSRLMSMRVETETADAPSRD